VKRVSWTAHLVLGLALGLAPLGAWIAVRGNLQGDLLPILLMALAVLTWVAGFDLIYACQDAEFDREAGLHSIPARFGQAGALRLSRVLHGLTVLALAVVAWRAELGWIYAASILGTAGLLGWEQSLVRPGDLSRVDLAFFTLNGWVGVALFVGMALDMALLGTGGSLA
jgi:4-hydroxybenzoate polyprenyltransferase